MKTPTFEESIEKRYAQLMKQPELRWFFAQVSKLKDPLSLEQKEFLVDQFRWSNLRALAPLYWVTQTDVMGRKIVSDRAESPEYDLFFIRLAAILKELPQYFTQLQAVSNHILSAQDKATELDQAIIDALMTFKGAFSEIQLDVLGFIRDRQSHIFVDSYGVRTGKNGSFNRFFRNGPVPAVQHMDRIVTFMAEYGHDDHSLAKMFAVTATPHLAVLLDLLRQRDRLHFAVL